MALSAILPVSGMNWNETVTTSLVPVPEIPEPAVLAVKPVPPPV